MFTQRASLTLASLAGAAALSLGAGPALAAHPPVSSGCGGGSYQPPPVYVQSAPVYAGGYGPGVSVVIGSSGHHHHRPVYVAPSHHGGHQGGGQGAHGGGHQGGGPGGHHR